MVEAPFSDLPLPHQKCGVPKGRGMELLARKTVSESELNHLALLQHAIFSGVVRGRHESLDGEYVMSEIQRLLGVKNPHKAYDPSPWELDKLQRQLNTKLETTEYVQFCVIVGELREVLASARRKALEEARQGNHS